MDTQKGQKTAAKSGEDTGGQSPYRLTIRLARTWAGLPGRTLTFNLRLYLSGEVQLKREGTIALSAEERKALLLDYRTRVLSDTLEEPPGGFPDFPDSVKITPEGGSPVESTKLSDRAYEFFSRTDGEGRKIFGLLIEDVVTAYWEQATPAPTMPASGS